MTSESYKEYLCTCFFQCFMHKIPIADYLILVLLNMIWKIKKTVFLTAVFEINGAREMLWMLWNKMYIKYWIYFSFKVLPKSLYIICFHKVFLFIIHFYISKHLKLFVSNLSWIFLTFYGMNKIIFKYCSE